MAAAFRKAAKSRQREHRERSQVGPHRPHELWPVAPCAILAPALPTHPAAGPGLFCAEMLLVNTCKYMLTTQAWLGRTLAVRGGGGGRSR